ncbi:MAG TPA: hypothetical protein VMV69_28620 [Pirellulales bacterium]|nr:hypothetical protein [Pirellulales bacterium]
MTATAPPRVARKLALAADHSPVVIIDTRLQFCADVSPMPSMRGTLATGDYSVLGLEHAVAIGCKSLSDLLCCVGTERERFEKEVRRLLGYPIRAIVCETTWAEIEAGEWRSQVTPAAAIGSCRRWKAAGVPVVMARDRERAGRYIARLLWITARRRWRELRALAGPIGAQEEVTP